MEAAEQIKRFGEFFETRYKDEIAAQLQQDRKFIFVPFNELTSFDIELAQMVLEQPEEVLKAAELAVEQFDLEGIHGFRIRFTDLPQSQKIRISDIRSLHLGKFVVVEGIVKQKSDVRPQVTSARFECPSCGNVINVLQLDSNFKEPAKCGCGRKGTFRELSKELIDAQGIVLEENPEMLEGGEQPKRLNIFLKGDLVSPLTERRSSPGTKIQVVGQIKEVPIILRSGSKSTRFDLMIEANSVKNIEETFYDIEIEDEEVREIREIAENPDALKLLTESMAPSIYGYEKVKEALILQLMGGIRKVRKDGIASRGDMHILLVGDPGSGKSQLLKRINIVAPKGRYVSGKGVSGAGITASVVKDEFLRGWSLEAGALVLANNGICCIDEMDKMGTDDRAAMHEALEQQCFHHDTVITFADGKERKIGEFVESMFKAYPERVIHGHKCQILPIADLDIPIFSTDWKKVFGVPLDRVSRHLAEDQFIRIRAGNGREIMVTPEHPVFVIEDGRIATKRADALTGEEWLPVPLKMPVAGADQPVAAIPFNPRAIHHIKVPATNSSSLYKIVGYVLSEGSKELNRGKQIGINFTNKDKRLLDDFEKAMDDEFSIRPYRQERVDDHEPRWMSRFISTELAEFFQTNMPEVLNHANKKEIPSFLMGGKAENLALMLSCMFEGDGHVSQKERTIRVGFASNSRKMCEQVQDILLRFSIRSNLTEHKGSYKVSVTGYPNILRFRKYIGFITQEKNGVIDAYLSSKQPIRSVKDNIPNVGRALVGLLEKCGVRKVGKQTLSIMKHDYLVKGWGVSRRHLQKCVLALEEKKVQETDNECFGFLKGLAFGDIGFEKIKEIETVKNNDQRWVYDVTIEPTHTFVSQNMILHNTISISKANIQATLLARTTVLAAANPKFGRFDPMGLVGDQIDLPPTLINRFDLIFPIKDLPNEIKDKEMASHILGLHQNVDSKEATIPTELLRKYIAYARQNVHPRLTDEAVEEIQNYYVRMRTSGMGEGGVKSIPISPRQLEALVRLSEASARVRLDNSVLRKDAKKAIELLEFCLMGVGFDTETGKIDIDRIATGVSASERSRIGNIKEIINELEERIGKSIPIEDIVAEARSKGIEEARIEEALDKLKRSGDIFEPRRGFIQKI